MATLHDIARHSGVSAATVSHVVNNSAYVSPKLRERVLKAIREHNYQPNVVARTLRTKASKTVGIFVPDIADPFFPALVRGAEDVFTHSGYTLLIGNSDNDQRKEERYYRAFMERRVDGLVAVVSSDHPAHYIQRHDLAKVPIVFADRAYLDVPADMVGIDNIGSSKLAVNHLIEMGYERIATITGPLTLANARDRLTGYHRALREAGLVEDEALIREGSFDVTSGYMQARQLLGLPLPPDAIFVQNGLMTLGAFRAIQEAGLRCPEEVGVISFADQEWFSLVRPQITGVAHDSYDIGALAAELLLKRITGKLTGEALKRNIAAKLIARESTDRSLRHAKEQASGSGLGGRGSACAPR
jgi:LacI family transcriptional regulator